jgi:hypothetical protein
MNDNSLIHSWLPSRARVALAGALGATLLALGAATSAQAVSFTNPAGITIPAGAPAVTVGNANP